MATVHLLDETLAVLQQALFAEHPTLGCAEFFHRRSAPPSLRAARELLRRATDLQDAITRYVDAVNAAIEKLPAKSSAPPDNLF